MSSSMQLPDRPALGTGFQKRVRVIVVPTGASSGARIVINTSQLPPIAEILIFDGTNQLTVDLNTGGVTVSQDFQIGASADVAMKVSAIDSTLPNFQLQPASSVGGDWRPALIDQLYVANAGGASEQQKIRWFSPYATPDRAASDRPSIQLVSMSRDGVSHSDEVNILSDIVTVADRTNGRLLATFRPTAAGGTPTMRLETTNALSGNRALDLFHSGDSNQGWSIDYDGVMRWGPGGGTAADTDLYRRTVNQLGTDDSFALATAGSGFLIKEGANATMGTGTLVGGTLVVNTTKVTANSRIFLTAQTSGAAPGALRVSARTAGTSFTVTSTSATDTSTFAWLIIEPS